MSAETRYIGKAHPGMEVLGPLRQLPGVWHSRGRGWNMIALPVAPALTDGSAPAPFRVLMNQYSETLKFTTVDTKVPNRGIKAGPGGIEDATQFVVTLDFFAPRRDGLPGRAEWPHISINMLDKLSDDPHFEAPDLQS
jgi:hypothetical protein